VEFAIDEDARIYCTRAVRMWRKKDRAMAELLLRRVPGITELSVYAGRDAFGEQHARRDDTTPSTAQIFGEYGITLLRGNDAKVRKRQVGMDLTSYIGRGPAEEDIPPRLRFFGTPEVREVLSQWEDAVEDTDDPETLLKVDANRDTGEGGDDALDASLVALSTFTEEPTEWEGEPDDLGEEERELARVRYEQRIRSPRRGGARDVEVLP
jgi:hypothetical protein